MEMTTPVISTGGQQGPQGAKMQFPIERKYGEDPEMLPLPNDSKYVLYYHQINPCGEASADTCTQFTFFLIRLCLTDSVLHYQYMPLLGVFTCIL